MSSESKEHIVEFDKWCKTCTHESLDEHEEPCWECMDNPVNEDSRRPVKWEGKDGETSKDILKEETCNCKCKEKG